jgi:hypothetical protein
MGLPFPRLDHVLVNLAPCDLDASYDDPDCDVGHNGPDDEDQVTGEIIIHDFLS